LKDGVLGLGRKRKLQEPNQTQDWDWASRARLWK